VRELRNALEQALMAARGAPAVEVEHLPAGVGRRVGDAAQSLDEVERRHIERTLRRHGGNRTRSAEELGISRATLINKIRTYALDL
jgi:transcriptional regulator with PAS, ATPase and Fis domain